MTTKADILEQKQQLIAYCASKLKAGDFHAVQDAASDIRELNAKLETLAEVDAEIVALEQQSKRDGIAWVGPKTDTSEFDVQ